MPDAAATASATSRRGDGNSTFAQIPSARPAARAEQPDRRWVSQRSIPRVGTAMTSGANGSAAARSAARRAPAPSRPRAQRGERAACSAASSSVLRQPVSRVRTAIGASCGQLHCDDADPGSSVCTNAVTTRGRGVRDRSRHSIMSPAAMVRARRLDQAMASSSGGRISRVRLQRCSRGTLARGASRRRRLGRWRQRRVLVLVAIDRGRVVELDLVIHMNQSILRPPADVESGCHHGSSSWILAGCRVRWGCAQPPPARERNRYARATAVLVSAPRPARPGRTQPCSAPPSSPRSVAISVTTAPTYASFSESMSSSRSSM